MGLLSIYAVEYLSFLVLVGVILYKDAQTALYTSVLLLSLVYSSIGQARRTITLSLSPRV